MPQNQKDSDHFPVILPHCLIFIALSLLPLSLDFRNCLLSFLSPKRYTNSLPSFIRIIVQVLVTRSRTTSLSRYDRRKIRNFLMT